MAITASAGTTNEPAQFASAALRDMAMLCIHCRLRTGSAHRELCWACRCDPAIWHQYDPPLCIVCRKVHPQRGAVCWACRHGEDDYEPSADEVEQMIAEGLQRLPTWWDRDVEHQLKLHRPAHWTVPVVRVGRR